MANQDELRTLVINAVCEEDNNDLALQKMLDALRNIILEEKKDGTEVTNEDVILVRNALTIIKENVDNADFSVDDLSARLGMHRTNLYRRLKQACNETPIRLIRKVRMEKAYYLFMREPIYVSQVAYSVGYRCPKNFSRHFREHFGCYPHQLLKRQKTEIDQ